MSMNSNQVKSESQTGKPDSVQAGAVLINTKNLLARCIELEDDKEQQDKIIAQQHETILNLQKEQSHLADLAQLGDQELKQKKTEILYKLRAIVHYTGDQRRVQSIQKKLIQPNLTTAEITQLHQAIESEFSSLYPTRALSTPAKDQSFESRPTDWSSYRVSSNQ